MKQFALGVVIGVIALSQTAAAKPPNYYRFEDGTSGAALTVMTDSGKSKQNGQALNGAPSFSADVPVTTIQKTGAANTLSLYLGVSDAIIVDHPFAFEGSAATLEFWVKPAGTTQEGDIFWTTLNTGNINTFNIGVGGGGYPFIGYIAPNGNNHPLGNSSVAIPSGAWSYLAFVKRGNVYSIYINGPSTANKTELVSQVTDVNPNLPNSTGWTINGRLVEQPTGYYQFSGLLDEIRISYRALSPAAFLVK